MVVYNKPESFTASTTTLTPSDTIHDEDVVMNAAAIEPPQDVDDFMDNFYSSDDDDDDDDGDGEEMFVPLRFSSLSPSSQRERETRAADRLSVRLLAIQDDDSEEEDRILRKSLRLLAPVTVNDGIQQSPPIDETNESYFMRQQESLRQSIQYKNQSATRRQCVVGTLTAVAMVGVVLFAVAFLFVGKAIGPTNQPVGPYQLVERQEGEDFFPYYTFYEGPDSVGSNGFLNYIGHEQAIARKILNVTYEYDDLDHLFHRKWEHKSTSYRHLSMNESNISQIKKPFVYMGSAPTATGPRDSIRLEGNRRFNRGLFIIDVRHMPAGCGVWPAFWLTDEANWPLHGEIDIVEGINYQSVAKTALHSTKGCDMYDVPIGSMTGEWDTAQGIPNAKTGIPDMTLRYAQNCFVYDPHQWLNQGCVACNKRNNTLGKPLNDNGGGVFALEWDPVFRHIRTWVFSPHTEIPENLVDAIATAHMENETERIMPNPELWSLPYGYFPIGIGTSCPSSHFRQMRLVFNTAFCGSVAGNRFQLDCPAQAKNFDTCNEYIASQPEELAEAYWKVRGVFVYEREWQRAWLN